MPKESAIDEVLEAIGLFSNKVQAQFDEVKANFTKVFTKLDSIEGRVSKIETTMVTTQHLDDVMVNLKSGSNIELRKEDHKLTSLVSLLKNKSVISEEDAQSINSLDPFPKGV